MNFPDFKAHISNIKTTKLGGLDAQFKLAPELRLRYNEDTIKAKNPKKAAVLALFYPDEHNRTRILLTKRASYKGTHSAQISFPGGKTALNDRNLEQTARRETFEEVGVHSDSIHTIRELTTVFIPPSNFLATPFIGYTNQRPIFTINYEVAATIEVLLEDLLNDMNISTVEMSTSYMDKVKVPCFKFDNYIIWGATAMMLSEIKELFQ